VSGDKFEGFQDAAERLQQVMHELYPGPGEAQARLAELEAHHVLGSFTDDSPRSSTDVFVAHGRDEQARGAIFGFLRTLGLRPLEHEQLVAGTGAAPCPSGSDDIAHAIAKAQASVIVLTPDNMGETHQGPHRRGDAPEAGAVRHAELNVLVTLGMALAIHPERTIILIAGDYQPASDLASLNYITLSDSPECRGEIVIRLRLAGCPVGDYEEESLASGHFADLSASGRQQRQDARALGGGAVGSIPAAEGDRVKTGEPQDAQAQVISIARQVVRQLAPDELAVFDPVADSWAQGHLPRRRRYRRPGSAAGFGIEGVLFSELVFPVIAGGAGSGVKRRRLPGLPRLPLPGPLMEA
jgi:predicted nucleotide-binding protein